MINRVILLFLISLPVSAIAQHHNYPIATIDSLYKIGNYTEAFKINADYLARIEPTDCGDVPLALYKSGETMDMLRNKAEAYRYLHQALERAKSCANDSVIWLATRYLGGFLFGNGSADSNLYYLHKAYDMIRDQDCYREISSVTGMLGETYNHRKNEFEKAIGFYKISLETALKSNEYRAIGYANFRYGSFLAHHNNCAEGIPMIEQSYKIFNDQKDAEGIHWTTYGLSNAYRVCGRTDEAFKLLNLHIDRQDSAFNAETARQTAEYQTLFQTTLKEKENLALTLQIETETRQRKNMLLFFSITLVLLMIIFILGYRQYNLKKKVELDKKLQAERERISRELHDNIGTKLSQVASTLDWVNRSAQPIADTEKKLLLDNGLVATREVIHDLRASIWALKKPAITFTEFADKLKSSLSHVSKPVSQSIIFHEQVNGSTLNPEEALDLLRICQEAVNNSLKHSQCRQINISLFSEGEHYQVVIQDDGIGFETHKHPSEHYGLENMQYRANQMGATLAIESEPGKGTSIHISK